jgi:hypothetical protein
LFWLGRDHNHELVLVRRFLNSNLWHQRYFCGYNGHDLVPLRLICQIAFCFTDERKLWKIEDTLFQISSMTNPLVFNPKYLVLTLEFSTVPSKSTPIHPLNPSIVCLFPE